MKGLTQQFTALVVCGMIFRNLLQMRRANCFVVLKTQVALAVLRRIVGSFWNLQAVVGCCWLFICHTIVVLVFRITLLANLNPHLYL